MNEYGEEWFYGTSDQAGVFEWFIPCHVKGGGGEAIFAEDKDRQQFLDLLAELITRYQAICYAYCLMDNHYHLLLEIPKANLSQI
ncbi:transposase [Nitrosomonas sp. Nm33]|uniref:transposase n=1 Tax=Nitrosomonas sp. Nm33 TaxID=133724 RepID=UPI000B860999